ncbi:MAG: ATP-binding cassette domain-containing protein [Clostridium sp.]|nr:ATP-binding cassette domain-containing protein [Clostridium sp.]
MEIVKLNNVTYSYSDGNKALDNVSISINEGDRAAIIGPNGAGKSTLFSLLNGILKPGAGTVEIDGMKTEKKNLTKIRQIVGMVFQDSDDQLFNSSIREEIAYGLINMKLPKDKIEYYTKWALKVVGMEGFLDKSPHNLSGGQKKRIALASVLAMKPKVMVLDEPTASLDPKGAENLIELLNDINKEYKITIIYSTHDVDIIPELSNKVFLLDKGKLSLSGSAEEVFKDEDILNAAGLKLPRVTKLIKNLKERGLLKLDEIPLTLGSAEKVLSNNLLK